MLKYFLLLFALQAFAKDVPLSGIDSQRHVHVVDHETLYLKGIGTHRRFVFDIYKLSLYLKDPTEDAEKIMTTTEIKYARMVMLRDLSASDLKGGFTDTYNENCATDCAKLAANLKSFLDAIPDMKEGSVIDFTFYPDKTLISSPDHLSLTFPGVEFGQIFLRAWVGKNPPSERFKNEILGLTPT